ncbi:MAG: hypothetical protein J5590_04390 [Clostridia bacterium]|nr:hypothetical protein [Clostridia bacterium]
MYDLILELASKCAASGCEDDIRRYLEDKLSSLEIEYDAHKTLIAHKKGKSSPVAIVCGMDVPSLFITHIEDSGYTRFATLGVDHKKLSGLPVRLQNGSRGCIWCEKDKDEMTDMFIDFGENTAKEAEPALIDMPPYKRGNLISGFALGNYAAQAAVIESALFDSERDAYFVFLSRSQLGKFSTGFMKMLPENTEYICVEKSDSNDFPGEKTVITGVGGGVCLRMMDKSLMPSRSMIEKALTFSESVRITKEVSKRNGIGGNLQMASGGANVISLGVPARYCDEICETVSIDDIKETAKLLIKFLEV